MCVCVEWRGGEPSFFKTRYESKSVMSTGDISLDTLDPGNAPKIESTQQNLLNIAIHHITWKTR